MGAVNLSNQYINWWKVLFFHLLDFVVVNSFILFRNFVKHTACSFMTRTTFGQLEYRESLAMSLMDPKSRCAVPGGFKAFLEKRRDCTYCNAEAILTDSKVPSYKTSVYCPTCNVSLCLTSERNCFRKWHCKDGEDVRTCAAVSCKKRKLSIQFFAYETKRNDLQDEASCKWRNARFPPL